MFANCKSLLNTPNLPSQTLIYNCYTNMFQNCSNIVSAELPATGLVSNCYNNIFNGCSNLSYLSVGFSEWVENSTTNWLNNTSISGTFVCPQELQTITGQNYIPENWDIVKI